MVRDSLQKAVFADFLFAWNQFRTNYKATFGWDSRDTAPLIMLLCRNIYGAKLEVLGNTNYEIDI